MEIAINTACYIGRETAYALRPFAWGPARTATVAAFSGGRFEHQFRELLGTIRSLGVSTVEIWSAHLVPQATPAMLAAARDCLREGGLGVASYAASLRRPGLSTGELERVFAVATAIGAPLIAGGLHHAYAPTVHALCRAHGVRFAIENHPEASALEVLAQIKGLDDWVGAAVDTGWFVTNGCSAVEALATLGPHVLHVHVKDVRAVGLPQRTCTLGAGVADIRGVLRTLTAANYQATVSVEHEPPHHDPTADLRESVRRLRAWLAEDGPA